VHGGVLLRARSFDWRARAALLPGATFRLHSVFERALNLRLEGDLLLGLVGPRGGNGPATVVLSGLPAGGFSALVRAGQEARLARPGLLAVGPDLAIDLAQAALWQPPVLRLPLRPDLVRANLARAADLAWRARGADGLGGLLPCLQTLTGPPAGAWQPRRDQPVEPGAEPPRPALERRGDPPAERPLAQTSLLLQRAGRAARALCAGWQSGNRAAAGLAAGRLIGLGPGQTPAGDDLLAGFFVARLRSRPGDRWEAALAAACQDAAPGRTTDLALARLRFAAQGELDERSLEALAALTHDDPPRLERAVRALLGYGHSSGLDTLVGLLLGLSLDTRTGWPWESALR
jgi:hypothetical protein